MPSLYEVYWHAGCWLCCQTAAVSGAQSTNDDKRRLVYEPEWRRNSQRHIISSSSAFWESPPKMFFSNELKPSTWPHLLSTQLVERPSTRVMDIHPYQNSCCAHPVCSLHTVCFARCSRRDACGASLNKKTPQHLQHSGVRSRPSWPTKLTASDRPNANFSGFSVI